MASRKTRAKYTSKGTVGTNRQLTKAIRRERSGAEIHMAKFKAFLKGKNVYFTIENPNPNETNKKLIRVKGSDIYGNYRNY
jgi:hypothetical protein